MAGPDVDTWTTINPGVGGDNLDGTAVTYPTEPTIRKRERMVIGGDLADELADVINGEPSAVRYGLVVRPVNMPDRGIFGSGIAMSRVAQLAADFSDPVANNRVNTTVTGGGAVAQGAGQATLTTGTATSASARIETARPLRYAPGHEEFAFFTARFTTPTSANSHQRAGLYDDNDGFFLGYQGLTFGFTVRNSGVDTFTALADASNDPLDGSEVSRFTRDGTAEVFDPTKLNVWRIRFGWLGSAPCLFEILDADSTWVTVHVHRSPNTATTPHIENPNLPLRMEVVKASADSTSLVMGTGSWSAGLVEDPYGREPYDVKSREEVSANATATGAVTPVSTTVYTVTTGRRFRLTDVILSIINTVTTGGEATITDGAGGTVVWRGQMGVATATTKQSSDVDHTFKSPPGFTTSVYFTIPAVGAGGAASINVYGYEEPL